MNARGWLEDGVDLALVGAVALWIGIAGAFLASLTPHAEVRARLHSSAPSLDALDVKTSKQEGRIPEGAFSCVAEDGAAQNLPAGFLDRLAALESGGDDAAVNAAEDAHGRWQVRAGYLADGISEGDVLRNFVDGRENDDEKHLCPLQLGVIERCVKLWSNPDDVVLSPFMGIGSEGYVAIRHGRRFVGCELKPSYFRVACENLRDAERTIIGREDSLFAL